MSQLASVLRPISLEQIVKEAERIGRLKIERDYSDKIYKAEIWFENSAGSRIWATGIDTDFATAIAKAIHEAERLQ